MQFYGAARVYRIYIVERHRQRERRQRDRDGHRAGPQRQRQKRQRHTERHTCTQRDRDRDRQTRTVHVHRSRESARARALRERDCHRGSWLYTNNCTDGGGIVQFPRLLASENSLSEAERDAATCASSACVPGSTGAAAVRGPPGFHGLPSVCHRELEQRG